MQDCKSVDITEEELKQYNQFKKQKKLEEARSTAKKLELDMLSAVQDKSGMRFNLQEAARLGIGAVCVPPAFVRFCSSVLGAESGVCVIACISYPNGGDTTDIKSKAVKRAIRDGAGEVEVTAPLAYIKDGNWGYVKREFKKMRKAAKKSSVRIILEAPLFGETEIKKCCSLAADAGIPCLRTAGGAHGVGGDEKLNLMQSQSRDKYTVKASGVADVAQFYSVLNCGAVKASSANALQIAAVVLAEAEK